MELVSDLQRIPVASTQLLVRTLSQVTDSWILGNFLGSRFCLFCEFQSHNCNAREQPAIPHKNAILRALRHRCTSTGVEGHTMQSKLHFAY